MTYVLDRSLMEIDAHEKVMFRLRENGIHSPTFESTMVVFNAIKSLCMLEKLKSPTSVVKKISMEMLRKKLNGPDAKAMDITGNGIEFSGWYTELFWLQAGKLITMERGVIYINPGFITVFGKIPNQAELEAKLFDYLEPYKTHLKSEIVGRANRFGLVNLLVDAIYTESK